ncbi:hypothetical protein BGZ63DRAFT_369582 [Mariannaea sp. PMI_226]|nr:hypothetical protein BGZ63DRAFT_369582 [Mariannaea sp. PMI_226]
MQRRKDGAGPCSLNDQRRTQFKIGLCSGRKRPGERMKQERNKGSGCDWRLRQRAKS